MKHTQPLNGDEAAVLASAEELFVNFAGEFGDVGNDPASLFAAHPQLEDHLRTLHRAWVRGDAMLRELCAEESLVSRVHGGLDDVNADAKDGEFVASLQARDFEARYELGRELGQGGMGVVLSVRDRVLGRDLAMKIMRGGPAGRQRRMLRRFLDEAAVIARLEHPGIVPIHELGVDSAGQVYFTMPLIRGRTLLAVLRALRSGAAGWSKERVLLVLLSAADAVAYAHSRGVLHRDVKPSNVMIGSFGEVYVLDWGLSRANEFPHSDGDTAALEAQCITLHGEVLGTPAYMAPEQAAAGPRALDERCDVYALGAILYELFGGMRPYGECDSGHALAQLRAGPAPALESLAPRAPAEICAIVRRAMARNRDERYPNVESFARDLRAFVEGRVVLAHERGLWPELRKWVARNRALSAAAVAVLSVAFASGAVLVRGEQARRLDALARGDANGLRALAAQFDELWPVTPEAAPAMERWIQECRAILQRAPEHRASLASLELKALARADETALERAARNSKLAARARLVERVRGLERERTDIREHGVGPGRAQGIAWIEERLHRTRLQLEELDARLAGRSAWSFEDARDADRHHAWRNVLELEPQFSDHGGGLLRAMEERDARARTLHERSIATYAREWSTAIDAIADRGLCPAYGGLVITPQLGLVPLGADLASGLWEFGHVESGAIPERRADGGLVLDEHSSVVLVLLPPGTLPLQRDAVAEGGQNSAAVARLDAFFIGKHELTQAQWWRLSSANPSYHHVGSDWPEKLRPEGAVTWTQPVEQISWFDADETLRRWDLKLPTEAQWEYAYRAGTTTKYYTGESLCSIRAWINAWNEGAPDLVDDDWGIPAPIGTFPPNPWGLHEIAGNVAEWVQDWFWVETCIELGAGDGATLAGESGLKLARGGSYRSATAACAAFVRLDQVPTATEPLIGARAARSLDP